MTREEIKKRNYENSHKIIDRIEYKLCTKCNSWLPILSDFYSGEKNSPDGFSAWCKKCKINYQNQYYLLHKEEQNKARSERRRKNIEKEVEYARQYHIKNKESTAIYMSKYQRNNKDRMKTYQLTRKQHKKHNITEKEWIACKEYFGNCCAYCGLSIKDHYFTRLGVTKNGDFHKDHVDHKGSNGLDNCIPACSSCNSQKWKFTFDKWYNKDNLVFSKRRFNKIIKWLEKDHIRFKTGKRKSKQKR